MNSKKIKEDALLVVQWVLTRNYYLTVVFSVLLTPIFLACIALQGVIDAFREAPAGNIFATRKSFYNMQKWYIKNKDARNRKKREDKP